MADDKLDPQRIMEKLRQILTDCEQAFPPDDWFMTINAMWRPDDGSRGSISFHISTERPDDDDE
jgi:hypothetical protein